MDTYPEDFNSNFLAKLEQFHIYVRHKFCAKENRKSRFSHAEFYITMLVDNTECAFPNADITFRILLTQIDQLIVHFHY